MVLHRASESDDRFIEKIIALGLQAINIPLKSGHLSNLDNFKSSHTEPCHNPFEIRASFEQSKVAKFTEQLVTIPLKSGHLSNYSKSTRTLKS